MRHRTLYRASILAVLIALPVSAAAQTGTVEQKAEQAADKVKEAARSAKTEMSDSWLTAKTKIALFADERVSGTQVKVETVQGVVTLRGKVDSEDAKAAADSIAKSTDGVTGVKNDLQVVPPTARKTVDANDQDISKTVQARLSKDPQLKKVDVRSDDRVVTLTGEVPSVVASAKASELARQVPGVRSVKNELTFTRSSGLGAAGR
jgi:hyperosmotically inducible protein